MVEEIIRQAPYDLDAEEAVLGSCLVDPQAIYKLDLKPEDFFREKNRWTWEAIQKCRDKNVPANQIIVAHELGDKLEATGGAAYLSHLVAQVPTSVHAPYYADILRKLSQSRSLIIAANQIAELGYQGDGLDKAEEIIVNLRKQYGGAKYLTPEEWASDAVKMYGGLHQSEGRSLKFGIPKLDRQTGGAFPGEFWLLAARPGVGKSTLLRQFARSFAVSGNVLYVSAEEGKGYLTHRFVSASKSLTPIRLRGGNFSGDEWSDIQDGIANLSEGNIYLYVDKNITTSAISAQVSRLKDRFGLDAVAVDYVQKLQDKYGTKAYERVSYISGALLDIARENNVVVMAACQLNRELEKERDRRPKLHELRDSGSLEQDCSCALLLYRADIYEDYNDPKCPSGQAKLFLAKHRAGAELVSIGLKWLANRQEYGELRVE